MIWRKEISKTIKDKKLSFIDWLKIYTLLFFYKEGDYGLFFLNFGLLKTFSEFLRKGNFELLNLKFGFINFVKLFKFDIVYFLFINSYSILEHIIRKYSSIYDYYPFFRKDVFITDFLPEIIRLLLFTKVFMMPYIIMENSNLKLKEIVKINNKLTKNIYLKLLSYRIYITLGIIIFTVITMITFSTELLGTYALKNYKNYMALISLLYLPHITMRQLELYKLLKEEAIEKGICKAEEFESQQS